MSLPIRKLRAGEERLVYRFHSIHTVQAWVNRYHRLSVLTVLQGIVTDAPGGFIDSRDGVHVLLTKNIIGVYPTYSAALAAATLFASIGEPT